MSPTDVLVRQAGRWRSRRGVITPPPPQFIAGVTRPVLGVNSGLSGAQTVVDTTTTVITGPQTGAPLVIKDTLFAKIITTHGLVDFWNCDFQGGPGTFDTGTVDCRAADVVRIRFYRCRFGPADTSAYMDGVIGHHYEAYQCEVTRVVDGFGVYNQYGPDANVIVEGCVMHRFAHFSAPTKGIVHPSDTHTHGDACQVQGGRNVRFVGNDVDGYCRNFTSSLAATKGYDAVVDDSTPTGRYVYLPQGFLTQENVQVGGVSYAGGYVCDQNWWRGTQQTIRPAARASGPVPYAIQVIGNRWEDMPYDWGGALHYYPLRPTTNVTLNGRIWPSGDTVSTPDESENRWADLPEVLASYRGQPVGVRCDLGG